MDKKLIPCPHCGKTDKLELNMDGMPVWCERCGSWDWCGWHEINNWGKRPIEDALRAERDEAIRGVGTIRQQLEVATRLHEKALEERDAWRADAERLHQCLCAFMDYAPKNIWRQCYDPMSAIKAHKELEERDVS